MKPSISDIAAALLWFTLIAFAIYLLGWSMNLWWILGQL